MTMLSRRPHVCFAQLAFALLAAIGAQASPLVVTNTNDSGAGSLRQAITASPAGGSIEFNIPTTDPGYAPLTGTFYITLSGGELAIGRDLTITGPTNAKLEISVNGFARAFNIVAGSVSISNLTIAKGSVAGVDGADGGNQTPAVAGGSGEGGGILNNGTLTLSNCTVSGNSCSGGRGGSGNSAPGSTFRSGAAGGEGIGAGISNNGTLTMRNCTVTGNTAVGGPGGAGTGSAAGAGGSARGSGVASSGALTMTNCTINGNSASGANGANNSGSAAPGAGGSATGGGVAPSGASTALLQNTIIAGNSVSAGTAGVNPNVPPAPNGVASGPDVGGTVMSQGHNLIGRTDGSNGWSASDLLGGTTAGTRLDPLLGPLQDNGGIAYTRRPLPGSAAIDSGDDAVTSAPANLLTDERNYPRKIGTHVDIGAVETGIVQAGPTFTVSNADNHNDGTCSTDDCTLLEALNASNASSDANTINFAPIVLGAIAPELFTTAGLSITNPVTINGPGARILAIDGKNQSRGFNIAAGATVTISGLTLKNCNSGSGVSGGAIQNAGTLTLSNCSVLNNSGGSGGGVATFGTLTVNNCT
ncbi:MAG: hypothetical protein M3Y69_08715, partial [Verrucomicrobiota bacterium]|nr:hypothetical protein [Verrucomicrobiota bacterium]